MLLDCVLLGVHDVTEDFIDGSEYDSQDLFGLFFHTLLSIFNT